MNKTSVTRCPISFIGKKLNLSKLNLILNYHDFRWCKPLHNDDELFAMLCLEIMQAGLQWQLILEKEKYIRKAFDNFKIQHVANYGNDKIKNLKNNSKIIKNELKIKAIVNNAKILLQIQEEFGSFDSYIWKFTKNKIIDHKLLTSENMPVKNKISEKVSTELKKRGFKFIGSVIVYSFMQSIGIFNDHYLFCSFR